MGLLVFYPAAGAGKRTWLELNLGHGVPGYAVGWFEEEEMKKRMEMWLTQGGTPKGRARTHPLWSDLEANRPFALRLGSNGAFETSELYSLARKLAREQEAELRSGAPPVIHRP